MLRSASRLSLLLAGSALLMLGAVVLGGCGSSRATRLPDVVLFVVDTLRADRLPTAGYERDTAPNLRALAERGVVFERARAPAPWTLPSVGSILTGSMPTTHGAGVWQLTEGVGPAGRFTPMSLAPDAVTIAGRVRELGYRTIGRSANPYSLKGLGNGFEEFEVQEGSADELVDWAIDRLGPTSERPTLLWLQPMDVHEPHDIPPEFVDRFPTPEAGPREPRHEAFENAPFARASPEELRRFRTHRSAVYDGAVAYVDHAFGRLLDALDARGTLDDTWIVFTSDHGEELWDHQRVGHGHTMFEELLHVPLVIAGPGAAAGHRVSTPVSLVDIAPTLLDCLGLKPELGPHTHGRTLRPALAGGDVPRHPLFSKQSQPGPEQFAMLDLDDRKLVYPVRGTAKPKVFDLAGDPEELHPLPLGRGDPEFDELARKTRRFFESLPKAAAREYESLGPAELARLRAVGYFGGARNRAGADGDDEEPDDAADR